MKKKILLTGDRPTGRLHLGHFIGSLKKRVELQSSCDNYIMIADTQAMTDNFDKVGAIVKSVYGLICDYLAVGISPEKSNIFLSSQIPEIPELAAYFLNLVTIARIGNNPTVREEVKLRGFGSNVSAGFYLYPLFQVADIAVFRSHLVPVGKDQEPMLELTREVLRKFNTLYKTNLFPIPQVVVSGSKLLPGFDGKKMSKSLNNAIYLMDEESVVRKKVAKMMSDPDRKGIGSPGNPDNAIAFRYLEAFCDENIVDRLKEAYIAGTLSDKDLKSNLTDVLLAFLVKIQKEMKCVEKDIGYLEEVLKKGCENARSLSADTLHLVKQSMGLNYFSQ